MGLIDRLLGRARPLSDARKAELGGDLLRAIELSAGAGRLDEVARLMLLRGDGEPDPRTRLQHYTQAVENAPPASPVARQARVKRASLVIALASEGAVSAAARSDLVAAARELEELGESERAADAYARVKDTEGEARALEQAGQVDRLETLLTAEQSRTSGERQRSQAFAEVEAFVATGRRREALAGAERIVLQAPMDPAARERVQALRARRAAGSVCRVLLSGRPVSLVLDPELVVGRTEGSIVVPSAALSRRHVAIARSAGLVAVRDLGSRNGTLLRGMRIAGALPVGEGLTLALGGEVKLTIAPCPSMKDAHDVEVGGERYVACLGPAALGVGAWRLERAADGWVELSTDTGPPAFLGEMALTSQTTLLVGDRVSASRSGPPVLEVLGATDAAAP